MLFEKLSCSLFFIQAKYKAKEGGRYNLFISIGSGVIFELAVNIIILKPNTLSYVQPCVTSGIPISLSDLSDPCEIITAGIAVPKVQLRALSSLTPTEKLASYIYPYCTGHLYKYCAMPIRLWYA